MADIYQKECVASLHALGFLTRSVPPVTTFVGGKKITISSDDRGSADLFVIHKGRAAAIEVKNDKTGLTWVDSDTGSGWRKNQREWAEQYCLHLMDYWLWITLGSDPPHYNPQKYRPRKTWLVPYYALVEAFELVKQYQNTIPYQAVKGMRKEIQAQNLDAITLFTAFELKWAGSGKWTIPQTHDFYCMYVKPERLPMWRELYGDRRKNSEG